MCQAHSIAIIGVGPKGLYCFERLLAEFKASPIPEGLNIHLINKEANFGVSPIYDINQPEYILVNIGVAEVDIWTKKHPKPVVKETKNFTNWYNDKFNTGTPITGEEYLSRAIVGTYLKEGFELLCDNVPDGITLHIHRGEATNIQKNGDNYDVEVSTIGKGIQELYADKILLATGHATPNLDDESVKYLNFSKLHARSIFVPFAYPVIQKMKAIRRGDMVAMKGMGLTFIDAVLELTEGRGGTFERTKEGELCYHSSGNEPSKIFPFSRQGLPILPKSKNLPKELRKLTFFTAEGIEQIKALKSEKHKQIDFELELNDLYKAEMELAFYEVASRGTEWFEKLKKHNGNKEEMRLIIGEFLNSCPDQPPMDINLMTDPIRGKNFKSGKAYTRFIQAYLKEEIYRATQGQMNSPTKAALEVWFEVRYTLGDIMKFGGLTPESHKALKEGLFSKMKRLVFGPPIINVEKIAALIDAGIIDYSIAIHPEIELLDDKGIFHFSSSVTSTKNIEVNVIVDARYPDISIANDQSPLIRNLFGNGRIRLYENKSINKDGHSFFPGAIDMTSDYQHIIDVDGTVNEDFSVIGIPTEHNLIGNLSCVPGNYPSIWAKRVVEQLQEKTAVIAFNGFEY